MAPFRARGVAGSSSSGAPTRRCFRFHTGYLYLTALGMSSLSVKGIESRPRFVGFAMDLLVQTRKKSFQFLAPRFEVFAHVGAGQMISCPGDQNAEHNAASVNG